MVVERDSFSFAKKGIWLSQEATLIWERERRVYQWGEIQTWLKKESEKLFTVCLQACSRP